MSDSTYSTCDVALVSMPWAPPIEPSLGLSILKSCLSREQISARVFHFAPEFLRWVKHDTYQYLADSWGLNDFVFTSNLDPVLGERQQQAIIKRVLTYHVGGREYHEYPTPESVLDLFMSVRHEVVPKFLEAACSRILASRPKIVGFTCLFDQTMASLALATELKRLDPSLTIVFGGYALEGPPGQTVVQAFPCVDYLVLGDGEHEIVRLSHLVLNGNDVAKKPTSTTSSRDLTGLLLNGGGSRATPDVEAGRIVRANKVGLDESPIPDYDDWFEDLAILERLHKIRVETDVLPVEASRGCWWGQHKHCVFCGIDDETLAYRYKDPQVALQMLKQLRTRYGDVAFRFSDYIMPKIYYSELLPSLTESEPRFRLHAEIKANHPPERVRLMADAGFGALQPGVESFSTAVLRSMDKGVRGIDNACLVKACYVEGIYVYYNILYGLPDDSVSDYKSMLAQLPLLYHLMPPVSRTEIVVTRFAPLQADPSRFGVKAPAVHHECYNTLFSDEFLDHSDFSYDEYCYYFERNFAYPEQMASLYSQLVLQVDHWKTLHQTRFVELTYEACEDTMRVIDSRYAQEETYNLSRPASILYRKLDDRPTNFQALVEDLDSAGVASKAELQAALVELDDRRLIWRENGLVLGLAIPKKVSDGHRDAEWPKQWLSIQV